MIRIIFMLIILLLIGFFSSFMIQKFTKLKIIILIPSILGVLFLIYTKFTSNPVDSDGLEGLRILIKEFIVTAIIIGNVSGLFFFTFKK